MGLVEFHQRYRASTMAALFFVAQSLSLIALNVANHMLD